MNRQHEAGFTFVEMTIVSALLIMAMGFIATSIQTATRSVSADELVAREMERLQESMVRIAKFARPCSITTYRVMSVAADVTATPQRATAVGEWIEPFQSDPRAAIQFRSALGRLALNATVLTSERELRLVLDDNELDNNIDDDGDGLIDEGRIVLTYDGTPVVMARDIESISFTLTGRLLTMAITSAARNANGDVQRFALEQTLYLRNN